MVMLLRHRCRIDRQKPATSNGQYKMRALYSDVPSLFIPMSAKAAVENNFSIGRGYDVYFEEEQDVRVGDRLVWCGGTYYVSGIQKFSDMPPVSHTHVMAEQKVTG